MAGQALVQATDKAGELYIPALGQKVALVEWREGDFWDSVYQAAASPVTAGTTLELFADVSTKSLQHCNLRKSRNVPSGTIFVMNRIGVLIAQAFSNTVPDVKDILKVAYAASLTFKIGDRLVSEGPLVIYSSGYGMSGSTTNTDTSLVTTGVPSYKAAPELLVTQKITEADDLNCQIEFRTDKWITLSAVMPTLAGGVVITNFLHGLIKKPLGQ